MARIYDQPEMPDASRLLLYARGSAVIQGLAWFVLGSFGGWGLVAGPMAWLAAIVAGRFNLIARVMLLLPISLLLFSWSPILFSASHVSGFRLIDVVSLAAGMVPGLIAVVLLRNRRPARVAPPSAPITDLSSDQ